MSHCSLCLTVYMMLKLLTQSFLTLNKNQIELIVFGGHAPLDELTQSLGPLGCHHSQTVRNLRVSLVGSLNERTKLWKTVFISSVKLPKRCLIFLLKTWTNVSITTRLDYCSSLCLGLQHSSLRRLQLVPNVAARLLTGVRRQTYTGSLSIIVSVLRFLKC